MKIRYILLEMFLVIFAVAALPAQNDTLMHSKHRFGAYIGLGYNFHHPAFSELPGVPNCCPEFDEGSGLGFNFGLSYEHIFDKKFSILAKLGYYDDSGLLSRVENETVSVDFQPYNGKFEHTIDASLASVALKTMLGYKIFNSIDDDFLSSLTFFAGLRFGYLITKEYSQKEQIIDPADRGKFVDSDSQIRNESSGDIPETSDINFSLSTALRGELPLNNEKTFSLSLELGFDHQLTNFVDSRDWTKSSLLANIGIIYTPQQIIEEQIIALDTLLPLPGAAIRAVGVENGQELPKATLKIEEFLSEKIQPLLNYVFFSHSESEIPERYKMLDSTKAKQFTIEQLYDSGTLDTYYHILNIIGKRLEQYPLAHITLTGCNSGSGLEKNNSDLSRDRARNVADYLTNVWKIEPNRIKIIVRNLPEKPSNVDKDDGIAENRRVEIHSDTWSIIAPIIIYDTIRTATPPIIRFYPESKGTVNADKWVINAYQQRMVQKSLFGNPPLPEKVDWNIDEDKSNMPKFDTPLYINFQLLNSDGEEIVSSDAELPLEQITIAKKQEKHLLDKKLDRFSLILFDFDRSEIDGNNKIIAQMINSKLLKSTNIRIMGHTDRMGEEYYNKKLSMDRAKSLSELISVEAIEIDGLGESVELYDNQLPEGRFYNRTVEVIAETPIQW
jgi:outer membrane protein OmpA-like peptidoglycan-associated protein